MKKLDCFYKGSRTYIHAPDIYKEMIQVFQSEFDSTPKTSKLSFRKIAHNQLAYSRSKLAGKSICSTFEASGKDSAVVYFLYETDALISTRQEYNEADIVKNGDIDVDKKEAIIEKYDRYSVLEISVALFKELCNILISNSVKWTFVEVNFHEEIPLYSKESIKVTFLKNIGTKMVISTISMDDKNVGILKFSSR